MWYCRTILGVFKLGYSYTCPGAWRLPKGFPREWIALRNQLLYLQLLHASFLKWICLRPCHRTLSISSSAFLTLQEKHILHPPRCHSGTLSWGVKSFMASSWRTVLWETSQRASEMNKEGRWKIHGEFFKQGGPLLFLLPSPHFLLFFLPFFF